MYSVSRYKGHGRVMKRFNDQRFETWLAASIGQTAAPVSAMTDAAPAYAPQSCDSFCGAEDAAVSARTGQAAQVECGRGVWREPDWHLT
jgi:hypothetical protein